MDNLSKRPAMDSSDNEELEKEKRWCSRCLRLECGEAEGEGHSLVPAAQARPAAKARLQAAEEAVLAAREAVQRAERGLRAAQDSVRVLAGSSLDVGVWAMSDALMSRIFSFLEDGCCLLDSVALVCRRWHRLSKDPQAWAGVRLEARHTIDGEGEGEGFRSGVQAARVLLLAPHLASLTLSVQSASCRPASLRGPGAATHGPRLLSALSRSSATVSRLDVEAVDLEDAATRKAVLAVLQRSGQMQGLALDLFGLSRPAQHELLLAVARQRALQTLRLTLGSNSWPKDTDDESTPTYDPELSSYLGELADALPALRVLELCGRGERGVSGALLAALLGDLASTPALRSLGLPPVRRLPAAPGLAAALRRCAALTELAASWPLAVDMLPELASPLRGLTLLLPRGGVYDKERLEALRRAGRAETLHGLRRLRLEARAGGDVFVPGPNTDKLIFTELCAALAEAAPRVRSLELRSWTDALDWEAAGSLLALPGLERVRLHLLDRHPQAAFPLLLRLPLLQQLTATFQCALEDHDLVSSLIRDFQAQRPHVATRLQVVNWRLGSGPVMAWALL